ncbi:cupin domain-containing protein [Kribbella sp. NBC_00709]|uniref:cupin domain-containing protein n=1 Tax=Kribbella sp. NBC_00709 TaxID=2975972 RepID=UPI002E2E2C4C|nr:cupin domain-containing protein [Kribbella sp. NBC_00709]
MQVIRAAEAPRFQLPGVEFTGLAAPSRGSAGLCTWKLTVEPGHGGDAPHTIDRDEVFMVLSGTVQVTLDGDKLGPGDAVVVPAGEPISLTNLGEGKAELHVVITAGFTGYMADGTAVQPPWAQ